DAVIGKKLFCLIFVEVHVESMRGRGRKRPAGPHGPGAPCRARGAWPARYSRRSGGSGAKDAAFRPHRAVRRRAYTRPQSRPGHRLLSIFRQPAYTQRVLRRELYLFSPYRLLEASLLALMVFGPGEGLIGEPRNAALATAACLGYLPAAIALFFWSR